MLCGCFKSVRLEGDCALLSKRRMLEPVLLVILVLISATTTTVNAIEKDICHTQPQDGQFKFSYRILDEFGDEASMLFWNGQLELTCGSGQLVDFFVGERKITKSAEHTATISMMNLTMKEASKMNLLWSLQSRTVYCTCPDDHRLAGKGRKSGKVAINAHQYPVCSEAEQKNCNGKQICVLDKTAGTAGSTCKTLAIDNCELTTDPKRRKKAMYKEVCLIDGSINPSECEAVVEAQSTGASKWPMVEAERCNNKLLKFWEGNHALRDNILIADIFTLKPADKDLCNQGTIECHLHFKLASKKKKEDVHGNCNDGWTVRAGDISEEEKTKLLCVYTAKTDSKKFRWQFYLYYAKVEVTYEGSAAKCSWPKWAMAWTGGKNVTDPVGKKCELTTMFSYPLKQIEQKFSLAYRKGPVTDIPTTTQPTTAQPARNATEATLDDEGKSKSSSPVGQLGTGSSTEHQKGETTTGEEAATKHLSPGASPEGAEIPWDRFIDAWSLAFLILSILGLLANLVLGVLANRRRKEIGEKLEEIEARKKAREAEAQEKVLLGIKSRKSGQRGSSSSENGKEGKSEKKRSSKGGKKSGDGKKGDKGEDEHRRLKTDEQKKDDEEGSSLNYVTPL